MVSNVIVNYLDGAGLGLTKGSNLFAEQGRNTQHVVVSADVRGDESVPEVRHANVSVTVQGFDIGAGEVLARKIAERILTMQGSVFTYDNGSETESYDIPCVTVRNWPKLYSFKDVYGFSVNIEMSYKLAIT